MRGKKPEQKPISPLLFSPASPRITPHIKSQVPLKTIVLTGNVADVEFPAIQKFERIENHHILYQETQSLKSVQISKSHILWIGHGEIYKEKYQLNIDAEHRIKTLKKMSSKFKNIEGVIAGKSFYSGAIEIKKSINILNTDA